MTNAELLLAGIGNASKNQSTRAQPVVPDENLTLSKKHPFHREGEGYLAFRSIHVFNRVRWAARIHGHIARALV